MKLQNLTIIFIIIILPIVLVLSAYIGYEIKTINKQNAYNNGLITATHDAIFAFELNTKNDIYANNAENKRSNIKASIKTFENSLSTSCNLGLYNNQAIEEYIPAIVFGLYDGFYMYSPTQTQDQGFKHELRNYVYYSEEIKEGEIDIVIRYTLDNYVAVSGKIGDDYVTRAGYLINLDQCKGYSYDEGKDVDSKLGEASLSDTFKYNNANILKEETLYYSVLNEENGTVSSVNDGKGIADTTASAYYKESIAFSKWFEKYIGNKVSNDFKYLKIGDNNDPENEESQFVQNKRKIMKEKIEGVLNSSITAYANKTRNNYKMPKFLEEDWDKIYNNISVISFVQGMNLGFKNYNNYCILNSTNNREYVNPNLMYFTDGDNYHDIRCNRIAEKQTTGYKIGSFEKIKYETKEQGEVTGTNYYYNHNELACYECVNGFSNKNSNETVYNYVRYDSSNTIKSSYFTSLARERYKTTKLLSSYNDVESIIFTVTYKYTNTSGKETEDSIKAKKGSTIIINDVYDDLEIREGTKFNGWKIEGTNEVLLPGYDEYTVLSNVTFVPDFNDEEFTITFDSDRENDTQKTQTVKYGEKAIKPDDPSKEGFIFDGWYLQSDPDPFNFDEAITTDKYLKAHWKQKIIKIQYYLDNKLIDTIEDTNDFYTPDTKLLDNRVEYKDKLLLGYKINNSTARVSYGKEISTLTYSKDNVIRLDAIYIDSNSIKCEVEVNSGSNNSRYNSSQNVLEFYTNTTEDIIATIKSENNNGNPKLTSEIQADGSNKWDPNGKNSYKIYSENEGKNTIKAEMILSYDGVSRIINETFSITVDRTAPVISRVILGKGGIFGLSTYVYAYATDNATSIRTINVTYSTTPWTMLPTSWKDSDGNRYNYALLVSTEEDKKGGIVNAEDYAGNKAVPMRIRK